MSIPSLGPHAARLGGSVLIAALFLVTACLPVVDSSEDRQHVLQAVRAGDLERAEGFDVFRLPAELRHASQGGEIVVSADDDGLYVVIFDFRGLNHYTGWVYRESGDLTSDPLGNRPFTVERVEGNWYRVDAG